MERRRIRIEHGAVKQEYTVTSLAETEKIARNFAQKVSGGEVVAFFGDLGAGKTTFIQAFARALGVAESVTSPTFIIMNIYPVSNNKNVHTFCHCDAYRLTSSKELEAIGFGEYSGRTDTVTAIEWPERTPESIPVTAIRIYLTII